MFLDARCHSQNSQASMRSLRLHPLPEADHECPHCHVPLKTVGWLIPGMRNLAELQCTGCGREFYGDLRAGQALYTPLLLEKESGVVFDEYDVKWFADWLRHSYVNRTDEPVPFEVEDRLPITRPIVLLNCLDCLYGHSLLKLLNAQYYLDQAIDLILIVPSFLKWMVPDGVAQVWNIGVPLARGTLWNDWLAREIRRRVETLDEVSLSVAHSHPQASDYDISRFTGVTPFPLDQWETRLNCPTVTYVWRDDRIWQIPGQTLSANVRNILGRSPSQVFDGLAAQQLLVVKLAENLRREWPKLDFAIAGLSRQGNSEGLPIWIQDLRCSKMDDQHERRCCERYASSHVVVGTHGSNLLLPTAHAGGLVELIGPDRWSNIPQDVLFREAGDCREMFFRYRFVPTITPPGEIASLISLLLKKREDFMTLMNSRERNQVT